MGVLDPAVKRWLGTDADLVYLHAGKARQLIRKHGFGAQDLLRVMEVLARPREVMRRMPARAVAEEELDRRVNLVGEVDGTLYHAVVRRSPDGKRLMLKTFYEVTDEYVEKLRIEAVAVFRRLN